MPQTVTHVSKKTENSKEVIKSIEALRRNIQFVSKEKNKKANRQSYTELYSKIQQLQNK